MTITFTNLLFSVQEHSSQLCFLWVLVFLQASTFYLNPDFPFLYLENILIMCNRCIKKIKSIYQSLRVGLILIIIFLYTADYNRDTEGVSSCLQQMETAANRLHKLCENRKEWEKVNIAIDSLHGLIQQLRFTLDISRDHSVSFTWQYNSSQHSPQLSGNSPQKRYFSCLPSHSVPGRSSLRSPCPSQQSQKQKAVRFFLTTSQQEQNSAR